MTKFFAIVATIVLAALTGPSSAAENNCVLIDFTAENSEFYDLNSAINTTKSAKLLGSILGEYDPLILSNVTLPSFKVKRFLRKDLLVTTTIDSLRITGLKTLTAKHVRVTSPRTVEIASYATGQVAVDATLIITTGKSDFHVTADLKFVVEKPTFLANIEANMYACAPGVSASLCSNMTTADLLTKVTGATTNRHYASIMKEVLMKFEDASVKSFALDFESISEYDLDFDSSSFFIRTLLRLIPDYSVERINKKGWFYDDYISTINYYAPTVLNFLIDSFLEPRFGATCLSDK